jgi:hypothetical protein
MERGILVLNAIDRELIDEPVTTRPARLAAIAVHSGASKGNFRNR